MSRGRPRCNTPWKIEFRNQIQAAILASAQRHVKGFDNVPYLCPSGKHWHLKKVRRGPRW